MKIPNKIKLGVHEYTINPMSEIEATQHIGRAWYSKLEIKLDFTLPKTRIEETLFHELVHLILDSGEFSDESKDEKIVSCLAVGIYQVLKENNLLKEEK